MVIAPATADLMARAVQVAPTICSPRLCSRPVSVMFAPAMHTEMWEHPATVANVATLRERGVDVIEPASGRLTGKDAGAGRLPEPDEIVGLGDVAAGATRRAAPRPRRPQDPRVRGRHPRTARSGAVPR